MISLRLEIVARFNPTHVENRSGIVRIRSRLWFNPTHVENSPILSYSSEMFPGSTPRMWRIAGEPVYRIVAARFNPTHVENSIKQVVNWFDFPVQPHACGE